MKVCEPGNPTARDAKISTGTASLNLDSVNRPGFPGGSHA
jgi:hypothetical protein